MATKPQAAARPPVIRTAGGNNYGGIDLTRALPAWIISAVMHAVIVLLFVALGLLDLKGKAATVTRTINTDTPASVDNPEEDKSDLTNSDLGNDPDVPLAYNVPRQDEVSVPGTVVPDDVIGIPGAQDGPTASVPPPPGAGTGFGGGGIVDGSGPGMALSDVGEAGGHYGLRLAGGFSGRSAATKDLLVKEGGGNGPSEAAVAAGLHWLAVHQDDNGRWSLDGFHSCARKTPSLSSARFVCTCSGQGMRNDTAGTAFGVLPFLAAGVTHKSRNGMTEDYTKNVEAALHYLVVNQDKKNGDFGGGMYAHGLATIAMCEAYGLTGDQALKASAQRGLDYIVWAQDKRSGGWRYNPHESGDTSVVGWQVMALKSGQLAGLNVPNPTLAEATRWLNSVQTDNYGSGYGYTGPQFTPTMTAVGLLCREYLGWSPRNPGLLQGVKTLKGYAPGKPQALRSIYFDYYATQVMHHMGGDAWKEWNPAMRDSLVNSQDQGKANNKAHQQGSWGPEGDPFGAQGGRIMVTSLSLLTLEVYYRHLPLYRPDVTTGKEGENK
jgi:hypothetical protein